MQSFQALTLLLSCSLTISLENDAHGAFMQICMERFQRSGVSNQFANKPSTSHLLTIGSSSKTFGATARGLDFTPARADLKIAPTGSSICNQIFGSSTGTSTLRLPLISNRNTMAPCIRLFRQPIINDGFSLRAFPLRLSCQRVLPSRQRLIA